MAMRKKLFTFCLLFIVCLTTYSALEAKSKKHHPYYHEIAVCALFRNEARFLAEWIEFHKLVGVTHFYLYNNLSDDNYREVLRPYIQSGLVELIDWPYSHKGVMEWNHIQCKAYQHAIQLSRGKVKWLAILDSDEYLFPVEGDNLSAVLRHYEDVGGVVVHWQMFGTSHVNKVPDDKLLIESLLLKADTQYAENRFVKSIVRPERVRTVTDPHIARYNKPFFHVNELRQRVAHSTSKPVIVDRLRINHYWSRDEQFFFNHKLQRREGWSEGFQGGIQRLENLNKVPDSAILRFVSALRRNLGLPV